MRWPARTIEERFWEKVAKAENTCWTWQAAIDTNGYGRFRGANGSRWLAHRLSYELSVGPIPDGLQIDHLCRNRSCVRPDHLEPVTALENQRRGIAREVNSAMALARTHCIRGHELTRDNTYRPPGTRARLCRTCRNAASRRHKERKARA